MKELSSALLPACGREGRSGEAMTGWVNMRSVNANALALMPGGEDSPDDSASQRMVDLSSPAAEKGGKGKINLFEYRIIINGTKFN